MGKIFLSSYNDEMLDQYFSRVPLTAYTEKTITNKFLLEKELEEIRQTAVAYDDEEMEKDCFCIAMPIRGKENIEGAFSVSMPKFRGTQEYVDQIIEKMIEAKNRIEAKIHP